MAGPGRPKQDSLDAMILKRVKHATFHQGVQFNGKVFNSLDEKVHAPYDIQMHVLKNGCLLVRMAIPSPTQAAKMEQWIIGTAMWHSIKISDEECSSSEE